jgi:integrase/recombinase XerD
MQELTIVPETDVVIFTEDAPDVIDAAFLVQWLFSKSEKTKLAYAADMRRFYGVIQKPLQDVTLADLQRFISSLDDLKPSSRIRATAAVKSALSFGVKLGWLRVNVGALVQLPLVENKLADRIMSEQDVARLLALETNARNHAILVLLYRGGLRCAEVCSLTWRNMHARDEDTGQVSVYGKGEKTRQVLLDGATWREVMNLQHAGAGLDDFVFQSRQERSRTNKDDRRLDESSVFRIVQRAAARAGLAGVSPHWMRHAHATHSLEHGAPITLVQATLGHASIETTSKYTHVRPNASSGQFLKV